MDPHHLEPQGGTLDFKRGGGVNMDITEPQKSPLGLKKNLKNSLDQNETPKNPRLNFGALQVPRRD